MRKNVIVSYLPFTQEDYFISVGGEIGGFVSFSKILSIYADIGFNVDLLFTDFIIDTRRSLPYTFPLEAGVQFMPFKHLAFEIFFRAYLWSATYALPNSFYSYDTTNLRFKTNPSLGARVLFAF